MMTGHAQFRLHQKWVKTARMNHVRLMRLALEENERLRAELKRRQAPPVPR